MKKSELRKLIREILSEQGAGPRPSGPPTKSEFQKLLTKKFKDKGYSDDEIAKLHPIIWIVVTATFIKYLDNIIDNQ